MRNKNGTHQFWMYCLKSSGKILAKMDNYSDDPRMMIGAVEPGKDGNYYEELIIGTGSNPMEYLDFIKSDMCQMADENQFKFDWDDVDIFWFEGGPACWA